MKLHPIGTRPTQKTPRRGWAQSRSGAVSYGYILGGETEVSPQWASAVLNNTNVMSEELHEQTQEIMALAT